MTEAVTVSVSVKVCGCEGSCEGACVEEAVTGVSGNSTSTDVYSPWLEYVPMQPGTPLLCAHSHPPSANPPCFHVQKMTSCQTWGTALAMLPKAAVFHHCSTLSKCAKYSLSKWPLQLR